jgi:hypothetical protein
MDPLRLLVKTIQKQLGQALTGRSRRMSREEWAGNLEGARQVGAQIESALAVSIILAA